METDTTLVRSDSRVELHTITGICLYLTIVIYPCNLECKDTLRLDDTLDDLCILEFRMLIVNLFNRLQYFMYRLEIFLLVRVLGLESGHQIFSVHILL